MDPSHSYHRSLIRLILLNVFVKPVWILGIDRWVQNEVGPTAYGGYFSLWGLVLTAGFLLDLGLSTMVQRELADVKGSVRGLGGLFRFKLILLFVYFVSIYIIGCLHDQFSIRWLWGLAIVQALNSFYVYLRAWVTATQDFRADTWFSVLDKFLLIPVCFLWLSGTWDRFPITIDSFIFLQATTIFLSLSGLFYYVIRRRIFWIVTSEPVWPLLKKALPYAWVVLLMTAHTRLDGYWIAEWSSLGEEEAGRYAAAYRLIDAANMLGYLVISFLLPFLSRHHEDVRRVGFAIETARTGLLLFSLIAVLMMFFIGPGLAAWLYEKDADRVALLLPILFGSLIGYSLIHVYGTLLTSRGDLAIFRYILAGALFLHVVLLAWWVPDSGSLGAAKATLVSQVLTGSVLMYVGHRQLGNEQPYSSYLVVIFTFCLIWLSI